MEGVDCKGAPKLGKGGAVRGIARRGQCGAVFVDPYDLDAVVVARGDDRERAVAHVEGVDAARPGKLGKVGAVGGEPPGGQGAVFVDPYDLDAVVVARGDDRERAVAHVEGVDRKRPVKRGIGGAVLDPLRRGKGAVLAHLYQVHIIVVGDCGHRVRRIAAARRDGGNVVDSRKPPRGAVLPCIARGGKHRHGRPANLDASRGGKRAGGQRQVRIVAIQSPDRPPAERQGRRPRVVEVGRHVSGPHRVQEQQVRRAVASGVRRAPGRLGCQRQHGRPVHGDRLLVDDRKVDHAARAVRAVRARRGDARDRRPYAVDRDVRGVAQRAGRAGKGEGQRGRRVVERIDCRAAVQDQRRNAGIVQVCGRLAVLHGVAERQLARSALPHVRGALGRRGCERQRGESRDGDGGGEPDDDVDVGSLRVRAVGAWRVGAGDVRRGRRVDRDAPGAAERAGAARGGQGRIYRIAGPVPYAGAGQQRAAVRIAQRRGRVAALHGVEEQERTRVVARCVLGRPVRIVQGKNQRRRLASPEYGRLVEVDGDGDAVALVVRAVGQGRRDAGHAARPRRYGDVAGRAERARPARLGQPQVRGVAGPVRQVAVRRKGPRPRIAKVVGKVRGLDGVAEYERSCAVAIQVRGRYVGLPQGQGQRRRGAPHEDRLGKVHGRIHLRSGAVRAARRRDVLCARRDSVDGYAAPV